MTNKNQLCPTHNSGINPKSEWVYEHEWIYSNDDLSAECSGCGIKGNFKIKELICHEKQWLPMDHESVKEEMEKWQEYYGSFSNCECSPEELFEGDTHTKEDLENEDLLWEKWIEREAFFCITMGGSAIESHVVNKILKEIKESKGEQY